MLVYSTNNDYFNLSKTQPVNHAPALYPGCVQMNKKPDRSAFMRWIGYLGYSGEASPKIWSYKYNFFCEHRPYKESSNTFILERPRGGRPEQFAPSLRLPRAPKSMTET